MAQLINRAVANGMFDEVPVDASTNLTVELTALEITKQADKAIWVKDELEYTLTVTNLDTRDPDDPTDPGLPVTDTTVTDTIDITYATLVAGSVQIDGVVAVEGVDYTYNATTGLLTVILGTVNIGTPRRITFRVEQAA